MTKLLHSVSVSPSSTCIASKHMHITYVNAVLVTRFDVMIIQEPSFIWTIPFVGKCRNRVAAGSTSAAAVLA